MKSQVSPNMALLMWLAMAGLFQIATGSVQGDIDYLASNMEVRYDVLDNLASESTFLSQITLTNKGQTPIKHGDWVVYFCNIRLVESKHLKHNLAGYVIPGNYGIRLTHVNGCLHKFETTSDFKDIAAGASFTFKFKADHWSVARTDVMPRWYVTAKGLSPQVINNTDDEELTFVGNFDTKEKWKRLVKDVYDPYTPEDRYARYFMSDLETVANKVVPTPVDMNIDTQYHVVVTSDWLIYVQAGLENEAALLKDKLGITVTSTPQRNQVIKLVMGDVSVPGKSGQQLPSEHESYSLEVDADKNVITITGKGLSGVFYGVQTLLGIRTSEGKVPKLTIRDTPRYGYRGMHLDVARNFVPKDRVLKLIDIMAMYKLNKFHFHLTDDEGWRLEIPGLPELTEVGSKRCFDLEDRHCLLSQLGSGPDSTSSGSGSYSVNDYKEILRYANERHVQVIPEFDMPGHGNAAIKSMLARYNKLLAQGDKPGAERYLLNEINDTSQYLSVQYYSDNAINPCMESTYAFVEHVVRSVVNLHNDSQPLTVFHFGGDEVAHGAWMNSSACSNLVERLGLNSSVGKIADQLKDYFVQRISNITANYSLDLAGWEDGLMDVKSTPYDRKLMANREVYGYAWNNIWEWGGGKRAYALANAGYKVVMAQATHLYFDHPYEPDPEERGYYWATRFTDTLKVFGFMPDDLYANIKVERTGAPLAREEFCKTQDACPDLMHKGNVVGIQGHLWTETVRNPDQMFAMIFPRLLALAERAWHKASWEDITDSKKRNETMKADWIRFAGALGNRELVRLDKMGVQYRVPPPGASAEDGKLKTMAIYPGLTVQYSADGLTWKNVTSDTTVKGKIKLRTRSADGSRYSRLVEMEVVATKPTVKGCSPCLMTSNMTKLMATVVVFFLSIWR